MMSETRCANYLRGKQPLDAILSGIGIVVAVVGRPGRAVAVVELPNESMEGSAFFSSLYTNSATIQTDPMLESLFNAAEKCLRDLQSMT